MAECPAQRRTVDGAEHAHDRILFLAVKLAADEEGAKNRYECNGENGGADHGECLGEGQRVKHLAFHPGESEDRDEGQDDDDHGEGDGTADETRGIEGDLPDMVAIVAVLVLVLLSLANDILGHDDAGIDQHSYGDGDTAERHDVRRDARAVHEEERAEDSQRQRDGDHKDAAEMPKEEHMGKGNEKNLFDERVAQRVDGVIDENAAVVERDDVDAGGQARLNLVDLCLMAEMTSRALAP